MSVQPRAEQSLEEAADRFSLLQSTWALIERARAAAGRELILSAALEPLGFALAVVTSLALKWMVDAVQHGHPVLAGWGVVAYALSIGGVYLLQGSGARHRLALSEAMGASLEAAVARSASGVPLAVLEQPEVQDRLELYQQMRERLSRGPGQLVLLTAQALRFVLTVGLLAWAHPLLLLLVAVGAVPTLVARWNARQLGEAERRCAAGQRAARTLLGALTADSARMEAQLYGLQQDLHDRVEAQLTQAGERLERARLHALGRSALGWLIFGTGFAAAILLITVRAAHGQASAGDVVLVISLASTLWGQIGALVSMLTELSALQRASGHVLWLEHRRGEDKAPRNHGLGRPSTARMSGGLVLEAVSFWYPYAQTPSLDAVSVELRPGEVVVLIGENGAGKSTLVNLLLGLYAPSSGRLLLDGVPLNQTAPEDWWARCTVTLQHFTRFELTLGESVGIGHLPDLHQDSSVRCALARAGVAEPSALTAGGLNAQLGRKWQGADLSGGQWQKVAVARGMMRPSPVLSVLDEPASALDADAETALNETLISTARRRAQDGTITVIVSHRLSLAVQADRVLVLEQGRLREQGTHQDLLAHPGLYQELYRMQQARHGAGEFVAAG